MTEAAPESSRLVDRRIALAREWDDLVREARTVPGFADFLQPPSLSSLLPAAADGPVAVINVSRWRCDALLVTDRVQVCRLPELSAAEVDRRVRIYLDILTTVSRVSGEFHRARDVVRTGDSSPPARDRMDQARARLAAAERRAEETLRSILAWLWTTVAEPVLTALGFTSTPAAGEDWPRLWWCPTGLLTLLPLHAAGDHASDGPDRPTVLDRVVSSYAPTVRALAQAKKTAPGLPAEARMLAVTVADVEGQVPLTEVAREREMLQRRFAGRCTVRDGAEATVADVRSLLPHFRWVHFSCHGDQILEDPSSGGLRLSDGLLTIAALSAGQYQGEFAFLSACKTATGGTRLADEAITLTAALHYTGYRHVIGTLWTVYDTTAAEIADAIYAEPFDAGDSARRLHAKLRELRDVERLQVWTPFTHTGP